MKINVENGLLLDAEFISSPHCDARSENTPIDLLVIHNISLPPGKFFTESIINFFCNRLNYNSHPYYQTLSELKVSSHLLITRTGRVIQFVPFTLRAWHAGVSSFDGRSQCNDFSVGIELEGMDDLSYELVQYQQLARICQALMHYYPITLDRMVGHSDIAPGRKTDPGKAFDWNYLYQLLEIGS